MDYIERLPLEPLGCHSAPHQLPLSTAVCNLVIERFVFAATCNMDIRLSGKTMMLKIRHIRARAV